MSNSDRRHKTRAQTAREVGMCRAASRKARFINRDTLHFLEVLIANPDQTATTDDAVNDLAATFTDGGHWRGTIPTNLARQGLIVQAGIRRSERPSRRCGYVMAWRGVDLEGIRRRCDELRNWLSEHSTSIVAPFEETLFGGVADHERADHGA